MRHHRKLTDDERRQIIESRAEGTSAMALARRFSVSSRTIYNTLNRAKAPGPMPTPTRTVTTRVSERELAGFMEALAERVITDRPAALRRLMGAADKILAPTDKATIDKLHGWGVDIQPHGAAINQIARKLNEAKLRGSPTPYTAEDAGTIRAWAIFIIEFIEDFRALWEAKRAATIQEVDTALAGLMPGSRLSCSREACDRCAAPLTACVAVALP